MNRNKELVPLIRNGGGSGLGNSRMGFLRPAILAMSMLFALVAAPAPSATETRLNIRITPRAAEMIAALERGMTPTIASASLPAPGSSMFFAQSCKAAGGNAVVAQRAGFEQLTCL